MKNLICTIFFLFIINFSYSQKIFISDILNSKSQTSLSMTQMNEYPSSCLVDLNVILSSDAEGKIPDPYDFDDFVIIGDIKDENDNLVKSVDGFFKYDPDKSFVDSWHIRFAVAEVGKYTLDLRIGGNNKICGNCFAVSFQISDLPSSCNPMPKLRFSENNFMEAENGDFIFSTGVYTSLAYTDEGENWGFLKKYEDYSSTATITRYDKLVSDWVENGGNTIKYVLSPQKSQDVEWDEIGNYDGTYLKQNDLDYIIEATHKKGIYLGYPQNWKPLH